MGISPMPLDSESPCEDEQERRKRGFAPISQVDDRILWRNSFVNWVLLVIAESLTFPPKRERICVVSALLMRCVTDDSEWLFFPRETESFDLRSIISTCGIGVHP